MKLNTAIIAGAFYAKNLGDYGMLRPFCDELRSKFGEVEIIHLSRHPDPNFDRMFGVRSIKNLDHESREASKGRWYNGLNYGDDTSHLITIREAFESANLLAIGCGPMLSDITLGEFRGYLPYQAMLCTWAKLFSVPVMIYGVEVVPLVTKRGEDLVKFICDNSEVITVRENISRDELVRVGVSEERVKVLPDPAMALKNIGDKERGRVFLEGLGIHLDERPVIGIIARHVYWIWDEAQFEEYTIMFAALCDWMMSELDAHILFTPHCFYSVDNILEDDREVAKRIIANLRNPNAVSQIHKELTLNDALDVYANLDLMVGTRHHAVAYAVLNNVPPVGLYASSHLNQTIGGFMRHLGLSDCAVHLSTFDLAEARKAVSHAWKRRNQIRKHLGDIVPKLHLDALKYFELAAGLMRKHAGGDIDDSAKGDSADTG